MIVSVAFRHPYITHSERQEAHIKEYNPKLNYHAFRDVLPYKGGVHTTNIVERFQESLYGFKPHAIQWAINQGHTKVIWLDPSVLPNDTMTALIVALEYHPVVVRTGDANMDRMCNKKALDWFDVSLEEAKTIKHVGGTVYGFNFKHPKAVEVFNLWKRAEEKGIFGNQDEFMKGHWADEACMALALYKCGVPQYYPEGFKYRNQKEL